VGYLKGAFKKQRLALKHFYHQKLLKHHDFSIISNNCWGTRTYKKFGLAYASPFQSLFIYAPDFIKLIRDFSVEKLEISHFITRDESKYIDEMKKSELYDLNYPIGVLKDGCELHFQHYKSAKDAKDKWDRRIERINLKKLIFKFSDGNLSTDKLIEEFDNLAYNNKICFTSKPYPKLKSVVYMDRFKDKSRVDLEWKYDKKYINIHKFINQIK
jgi:uncharacterized protein (DUF1919 family)